MCDYCGAEGVQTWPYEFPGGTTMYVCWVGTEAPPCMHYCNDCEEPLVDSMATECDRCKEELEEMFRDCIPEDFDD